MNVITDVNVGEEKKFYSVQVYMGDVERWLSLKDTELLWDAVETCNLWNDMLPDLHRVIETTCSVSVAHSDYPEFN